MSENSLQKEHLSDQELEVIVNERGRVFISQVVAWFDQLEAPDCLELMPKMSMDQMQEKFENSPFSIYAVRSIYGGFRNRCNDVISYFIEESNKNPNMSVLSKLSILQGILVRYSFLQIALGQQTAGWLKTFDQEKVLVYCYGDYPNKNQFSEWVGRARVRGMTELLEPHDFFIGGSRQALEFKTNAAFLIRDEDILDLLGLPIIEQLQDLIAWVGEMGFWETTLSLYRSKAEMFLSRSMLEQNVIHEEIHQLTKRAIMSNQKVVLYRWLGEKIAGLLSGESFLWEGLAEIWSHQMQRDVIAEKSDLMTFRLAGTSQDSLRGEFKSSEVILKLGRGAKIWNIIFGYMACQLIGVFSEYKKLKKEHLSKFDPQLVKKGTQALSIYLRKEIVNVYEKLEQNESFSLSYMKRVMGIMAELDELDQQAVIEQFLSFFDNHGIEYALSIFEWNQNQGFLTTEEIEDLEALRKLHGFEV